MTVDGKAVGEGLLGQDNPLNMYYAYGIRNSFGIAFDPLTGNLWDTENGPGFGDEINLVYQALIVDGSRSRDSGQFLPIIQYLLKKDISITRQTTLLVS